MAKTNRATIIKEVSLEGQDPNLSFGTKQSEFSTGGLSTPVKSDLIWEVGKPKILIFFQSFRPLRTITHKKGPASSSMNVILWLRP